jgi:hypothetical protein
MQFWSRAQHCSPCGHPVTSARHEAQPPRRCHAKDPLHIINCKIVYNREIRFSGSLVRGTTDKHGRAGSVERTAIVCIYRSIRGVQGIPKSGDAPFDSIARPHARLSHFNGSSSSSSSSAISREWRQLTLDLRKCSLSAAMRVTLPNAANS